MKKLTGLTNKEIGELFGIGYTAVSKVYSRIEEKIAVDKNIQKRMKLQM